MKLSIVIPVYNEEKRLPKSLEKIEDWLKKQSFTWELLIVNDGSTDTTLKVCEDSATKLKNIQIISYYPNKGKGYAIKTGILKATGDIIIFSDADLSTPINQIGKLVDAIRKGADIAVGSRFDTQSQILTTTSPVRQIMSRIFFWGTNILLFYGPKDTQCGFKGFTKEAAKKIFSKIQSNTVLFDLEIFLLAQKFGYKIAEIPVIWKHDPDSRLTYNLKKSLLVWLELFRLKVIYKIIFPIKITTEL